MSKKMCNREEEVLACLKTGKLSSELQEHIAGCSVCWDVALVQGWMDRYKENALKAEVVKKVLPNAESMWNRVYARSRPDKKLVQKAMRPLLIPQVLFYGMLLASIISMTIWGFKKFGTILDSRVISLILPFFGITMFIVIISLSFCAIVVAFDKRKHPV